MSSVSGGMLSLVGMVIWHWNALKTKQSPTMFLKHIVSNSMFAKLHMYQIFSDIDLKFGMDILLNLLLVAVFDKRA